MIKLLNKGYYGKRLGFLKMVLPMAIFATMFVFSFSAIVIYFVGNFLLNALSSAFIITWTIAIAISAVITFIMKA